MNELAKKWIETLRNGSYEQSRGRLRENKGFCCLGVLCDIVDETKWVENAVDGFSGWTYKLANYAGVDVFYPPKGMEHLVGLTRDNFLHLSDQNDEGFNFKEIANEIERLVEKSK